MPNIHHQSENTETFRRESLDSCDLSFSSGSDDSNSSRSSFDSLGTSPPRSILTRIAHYEDEDEERDKTTEHDRHVHWAAGIRNYTRETKKNAIYDQMMSSHHANEDAHANGDANEEDAHLTNSYLSPAEAAAMMKKYGGRSSKHGKKGGKSKKRR